MKRPLIITDSELEMLTVISGLIKVINIVVEARGVLGNKEYKKHCNLMLEALCGKEENTSETR